MTTACEQECQQRECPQAVLCQKRKNKKKPQCRPNVVKAKCAKKEKKCMAACVTVSEPEQPVPAPTCDTVTQTRSEDGSQCCENIGAATAYTSDCKVEKCIDMYTVNEDGSKCCASVSDDPAVTYNSACEPVPAPCTVTQTRSEDGSKCCKNIGAATAYTSDCKVKTCIDMYTVNEDGTRCCASVSDDPAVTYNSHCCKNIGAATAYTNDCKVEKCIDMYTVNEDGSRCCASVSDDPAVTYNSACEPVPAPCTVTQTRSEDGSQCCENIGAATAYTSDCKAKTCIDMYTVNEDGSKCCASMSDDPAVTYNSACEPVKPPVSEPEQPAMSEYERDLNRIGRCMSRGGGGTCSDPKAIRKGMTKADGYTTQPVTFTLQPGQSTSQHMRRPARVGQCRVVVREKSWEHEVSSMEEAVAARAENPGFTWSVTAAHVTGRTGSVWSNIQYDRYTDVELYRSPSYPTPCWTDCNEDDALSQFIAKKNKELGRTVERWSVETGQLHVTCSSENKKPCDGFAFVECYGGRTIGNTPREGLCASAEVRRAGCMEASADRGAEESVTHLDGPQTSVLPLFAAGAGVGLVVVAAAAIVATAMKKRKSSGVVAEDETYSQVE